jgi:integrase
MSQDALSCDSLTATFQPTAWNSTARCELLRRDTGESVKTVQSRLGHASAVETLDTYSHLWPDSDDRTRDAIDSVLGFTADALRMDAAPTS